MGSRRRLDVELMRRALVTSRGEAQELIAADRVLVNGAVAAKPSRQVAPADAIVLEAPAPRFVSRAGEKLEFALSSFGVDVSGARALDAGASTGGFTDCLLQRGAAAVIALDVGHGQLHERIRGDRRVITIERENVRHVTTDRIGGPVDLIVGDMSFISLKLVIEPLVGVCRPGGTMVLLVKPQFEAGRAEAARGRGVIRDPEIHERVRAEITDALLLARCHVEAWADSPITGSDGNREFLVHCTTPIHVRNSVTGPAHHGARAAGGGPTP
jgi:23S rRNA (cytidine1920-2'-O)/16S rRNA (cytidine1409-2'-O)-methyltransferase